MSLRRWITVTLTVSACLTPLAALAEPAFLAIPLGTSGGLYEDDLSSYLLAPKGSGDFLALDAGTLMAGLRKAAQLGSLDGIVTPADGDLIPAAAMLQRHIKAYLISHPHLDHLAGLVINAPDDAKKDILGTGPTIDRIRDHLFNWQIWPAFGSEGSGVLLGKYRYVRLVPAVAVPVAGTGMTVEPFALSHADGYPSTAFLVSANGAHVLYCGDTGPDAVEKSDRLQQLWRRIAPLVRTGALKAIFIEASYPDGTPDTRLFGHLTPAWLMAEMHVLAAAVDPAKPATALQGLTVVVTHVKPSMKAGMAASARIMQQLQSRNDLGVHFVLPEQGRRLAL
ncbi:MAG: 3',5'-cyclic-nucleotide phosphodiesterase [Candidatus Sericytochromatia bacterium]|nr:3',5'-cyclic-nucleotide phosphodiesterase [Candidatus Sericytochromatia bacterium]